MYRISSQTHKNYYLPKMYEQSGNDCDFAGRCVFEECDLKMTKPLAAIKASFLKNKSFKYQFLLSKRSSHFVSISIRYR